MNNSDYLSYEIDDSGYVFVDKTITEYIYTYLDDNKKVKSDWTDLKLHEFARKHNVSVLKTMKRTRMISD